MAVGRISGPLLKDNLLRNGVDLAFETDLLYLDVNNGRVGIKTKTPTNELSVVGTTKTTNLQVTTQADIASFTVTGSTIASSNGTINLVPSGANPVVYQSKISVNSDLQITTNTISTTVTNSDLTLNTAGTGKVVVNSDTLINGDLHVTGDITADGTINIGDQNTDNIVFNAEVNSDFIPDDNNTWSIGSNPSTGGKEWANAYIHNIYSTGLTTTNLTVDGIDLALPQGNIYYVATTGSDSNSGVHQNDPYLTIKYALSQASTGDTVLVYPGTYTEIFPLSIPQGVTLKGTGIRAVKIVPTTGTKYNDAVLLDGETTVEDLTIADFFSGGNYFTVTAASAGSTTVNVGTAPFAHTYVSGGTIKIGATTYNITNAVYTYTTGVLVLTHTGGTATPGDSVFVSNLTFSCAGAVGTATRVFPDNGYAFRFKDDFTVTTRSPYIRNITVITKGSVTSVSDPYGFDSGDAGKGAYIDGAYANPTSREASMLFHSVTFITPNVDTITAKNGVRIEWLNSFTYFANKGINAISSAYGLAQQGLTRLRINNRIGAWSVGNTLSYYDTDGTTLLASGTIASIDGNFVNLTGRCLGFETITDRAGKTVYAQGDAKLSTSQKKFGVSSLALDGTGDYASISSTPDFAFGYANRAPKTITVTGDAAISATQSKFGGKSISFDGTGDKVTVSSSSDFAFGTGDFTAEAWIYRNTATGAHCIFDFRSASAGNNGILLFTNNNIQYYVGGATRINVATAGTAGAWNHVALVRNAGTTRVYLNGTSVGSYVDGQSYATSTVTVGSYYNNTAYFNGYIDEVRVSNTARYTGTFTVPASAFTHDANSLLLVHGDTDISDDAGSQTDGIFALEAWVYTNAAGTYQPIFEMRNAPVDTAIFVGLLPTREVYVYINGSIVIQSTSAVALTSWTHIALTKQNHNLKLFINGVQEGSTYTDTTTYPQRALTIGATYDGISGFSGYIDDVRVSKGVSRYTSNFAVPTSQLSGDLSTILLLHFDGPNNSTTFIDDGLTFQDLRTSGGGTATLINFADYSDFGAEIRSIGSAHIYGNYGTYGDGPGVIAYLISQNFAYIGSGKLSTNDPDDRIAANEVVELNDAKIYYTSVDNEGNFKVGDNFYVNQKTGEILFNNQTLNITTQNGVVFTDGVKTTTIFAGEITTGNIKIYDNNIDSTTGPINLLAYDGNINLNSDVNISGNLDVTGNVTIGGNITIGDQNTDSITFIAAISSDLIPATDATYNLGQLSPTELRWNNIYVARADINGMVFENNQISTSSGNNDLTLDANGTGIVYVPNNDVQVDESLTVGVDLTVTTGTTSLQNTTITGTLTQVGDYNQTGNFTTSGDLTVSGDITGSSNLVLPKITVSANTISVTETDTDLILQADGTGIIHITSTDVTIDQNLTVGGTLDVTGDTTFGDLTVNGTITQTGDYNQTGNFTTSGTIDSGSITSSGTLTLPGITISNNTIESTTTDTDLTITADGTGIVNIPSNDVNIDQDLNVGGDLTVTGDSTINDATVTGDITQTGNFNQTGDFTTTGNLTVTGSVDLNGPITIPNITISGSSISTNTGNLDLVLTAQGTGKVVIQDVGFNGTVITGEAPGDITISPQGVGGVIINSTSSLTIPVGATADRPLVGADGMVRYNTSLNRYEGFANGAWVALAGIESSSGATKITPELTPGAGDNIIRFYANNTLVATIDSTKLYAISVQTDELDISNNTISAVNTDTDINITTAGTGGVVVGDLKFRNSEISNTVSGGITQFTEVGTGYVKIAGTYGTVLPSGNNATRPSAVNAEVGMTRYNTELQYVEVWNGTVWQNVAAQSGGINFVDATSLSIVNAIVFG